MLIKYTDMLDMPDLNARIPATWAIASMINTRGHDGVVREMTGEKGSFIVTFLIPTALTSGSSSSTLSTSKMDSGAVEATLSL